ncbi:hypothetical protein DI396_04990 [Litorivita pollutaquae]|uniref:Uncharacterized protein n=1 Tax=Litorivita pollutaquae TaxID=2200892 RepID=A0A2V4MS25_9RHOB|nr:hypothetical protein [Litorivita pollutaquae]OUS21877.1 hypothetical protein A9Q95_02125 [Rhodobacterales bacterium 59_46_T64]PYC48349.1 hypothetical protein DI396_04990 [Litorivita pollutaquae]
MNPRHLLRMAKWARKPPSMRQVKIGVSILLICMMIFAVEYFIGWPDALTMERVPKYKPD